MGILGKSSFFQFDSLVFQEIKTDSKRLCSPTSGPLIKAEVGEQIVIAFKNKASRPYSITPYGVKASGAHVPVQPGERNSLCIFYTLEDDNDERVKETWEFLNAF